MTQELEDLFSKASQAISSLGRYNGGDNETIARGRLRDIQRALENYVVIPKGKNRHSYADVLHEWVEGSKMQKRYMVKDSTIQNQVRTKWIDFSLSANDEYRIEPPKPVFEYQYATLKAGGDWLITGYLTDDEVEKVKKEIPASYLCLYEKLEFTKRERK